MRKQGKKTWYFHGFWNIFTMKKMDNVENRYIFYVDIDINTSKILHSYPMATI